MSENNLIQRLVWNFEISQKKFLSINELPSQEPDELKWEMRLFWPESTIITLSNIDPSLLTLANYTQKNKEDCYYLVPRTAYNLKCRREQLLYKPIIKRTSSAVGFGPKISLEEGENTKITHLKKLVQQIKKEGVAIPVKKESFTYKFATSPPIKLELARLEVNEKIYFSVCVEGKSLNLVETIGAHLLGKHVSCDYVTFLKSILNYD